MTTEWWAAIDNLPTVTNSRTDFPFFNRRNEHCNIPPSASQGQAPLGWLLFPQAQNLRTTFALLHAIEWSGVYFFSTEDVTGTLLLSVAISIIFVRIPFSEFIILVSSTIYKNSYLTLLSFSLSEFTHQHSFVSHPLRILFLFFMPFPFYAFRFSFCRFPFSLLPKRYDFS